MDHGGKVPYIEGQSIGIIAPGPDKKGETPAKIRLYSIASSAPGDDETSKTVSLVVKRVLEVSGKGWCEYSNVPKGKDPEFPDAEKVYRGVCSSHVCDLNAGDDVMITGPTGAEMLLPEDPEANMIFMATGTGIAPFRSHLRYLFHDKATKGKFKGVAWMFLGVPYSESLLYDEEWKEMQAEFPDQFRYDYAISGEEKSEKNKINGHLDLAALALSLLFFITLALSYALLATLDRHSCSIRWHPLTISSCFNMFLTYFIFQGEP